jgi:hypothetical protein
LTKSNPARDQEFSVIYVSHADDLSEEGFPFATIVQHLGLSEPVPSSTFMSAG